MEGGRYFEDSSSGIVSLGTAKLLNHSWRDKPVLSTAERFATNGLV